RLEREIVGRAVVSAEPHVAFVVYVDAVLALWPLMTAPFAAPRPDEIACRIEHDDGRSGHGSLVRFERARAMQNPYVVLRIDGDARCISDPPLFGPLGPSRVDLELRHA